MFPILVVIFLVCFAVFIVWNGLRTRKEKVTPLPREVMEKGVVPYTIEKWKVLVGISSFGFMLAASEWHSPSNPPFTGRWSWLESLLYNHFGIYGNGAFYAFCGLAFLATGFFEWKSVKNEKLHL